MSSTNDKRSTRSKISKKSASVITRANDGKRKHTSDFLSDTENKSHKKRYSLPPNDTKEMILHSDELLEMDSPLSDLNGNISYTRSRSLNSTPDMTSSVPEKRRSLRQQALHSDRKNAEVSQSSPQGNRTEKICEITLFDQFTPQLKENSPLPSLPWADRNEVWRVMIEKDQEYKRDSNYLDKHPKLRPRMRSVLLDWLIEVSEVYRLHRETFYLAVDFVDRYLSIKSNIAKDRLQLVGVTSLFVASKIEEIYPPKLNEFSYVTDGACTEDEIIGQEVLLMQALNWKLSPVTPISWATVYLQIINNRNSKKRKNKDDDGFEFPQFSGLHLSWVAELIDLCCLDIGYLQFSACAIASSALYFIIGKESIKITGQTFEEIYSCINWLEPFAQVVKIHPVKRSVKKFDKIPTEDAHNIQVHNNGIQLLDYTHSHFNKNAPISSIKKSSPMVECKGILTPPASTEKDYSFLLS